MVNIITIIFFSNLPSDNFMIKLTLHNCSASEDDLGYFISWSFRCFHIFLVNLLFFTFYFYALISFK